MPPSSAPLPPSFVFVPREMYADDSHWVGVMNVIIPCELSVLDRVCVRVFGRVCRHLERVSEIFQSLLEKVEPTAPNVLKGGR